MKIKEIKEYINDSNTTMRDIYSLHLGFLSEAGSSSGSRREKQIQENKGWNILKWAEKRFGKGWWK